MKNWKALRVHTIVMDLVGPGREPLHPAVVLYVRVRNRVAIQVSRTLCSGTLARGVKSSS